MGTTTQTTVLQTQTLAGSATTSARLIAFDRFDSSLGTLVDVRLTLIGNVTGTASIENLGAAAASIKLGLSGHLELLSPGGIYLTYADLDPTASVNLGAYDGAADYAGTSGTVVNGLSGTATNQFVYTPDSTELAQFSGAGTVNLTVLGTTGSDTAGSGNLLTQFLANTGAVVSLQYDYIAAGAPGAGGGGGGASGSVINIYSPPFTFLFFDPAASITPSQTFTVADATAGWNNVLPVARFNSALGTLEAVNVYFNADSTAHLSAENLGSAPIYVTATAAAVVTLTAGSVTTTLEPNESYTASLGGLNLGAYDGTTDFAGVSGTADVPLSSSGPFNTAFSLTKPDDLALFTGAGTVDVPITSAGTSVVDGSGNMVTRLTDLAGAGVRIEYVYKPASPVICFLPGTHIATPEGERPIETLRAGECVVTASGRVSPIVWIGTGQVLATRGQRSAATPVIIRRGALADNVPNRDLRVTKAHALYLDGVLIPVEFLVNHRSILWDDRAQAVSLFHIELEAHDVLLANGAPAESYRDDGNRWLFQNANSGWHLPPKRPCAPVLTGGPIVDTAWRRLLDRAVPRPAVPLTGDPDLHLLVDGRRIDPLRHAGGAAIFTLFRPCGAVRIRSRSTVPQEIGTARDPRPLGIAIRRLAVRQGTRFQTMEAADTALVQGFHDYEPDGDLRWTDGDATVASALFDAFDGPVELVLTVAGTTQYLDEGLDIRAA